MNGQVTIKDIAKEAGVSISTVSRVVNSSLPVKKETKEKVLKAIENKKGIFSAAERLRPFKILQMNIRYSHFRNRNILKMGVVFMRVRKYDKMSSLLEN